MRLSAVRVHHFRCIEDETLRIDDLTVLVGPNGAGKSSFLRALNYFYEGPVGMSSEDFYNRDTGRPLEITVMYAPLTDEEKQAFAGYVHSDALSVCLRVTWLKPEDGSEGSPRGAYHGWVPRHEPFQQIRAAGGATEKLKALRDLVASDPPLYDFAPDPSAWGRAEPQMAEWERDHPTSCSLEEDDGGYFRAPNAGAGPLARHTQLIFVPAVRDASEEGTESRTNTIGRLVSLVIGDVSTSDAIQQLSREFKERYAEAVRREESERLPALQQQLTDALRGYVAHAGVRLQWQGADVSLTAPTTAVKLEDDGFLGDIEGKGHGLQRLFIVSVLQVAAAVRARRSTELATETAAETIGGQHSPIEVPAALDYVLAIEEPELYQHPMQARRFAAVLSQLVVSGGAQPGTQVVYSTHSPLFVQMERFDSIRLARKWEVGSGLPLVTRIRTTSLNDVMTEVSEAFGKDRYSSDRFRSTLGSIFSQSVSEGFFARMVVLVEGLEDHAVVEAGLRAGDVDLEGGGIAVIPVEGKANLDRPHAIFTALGIPCYVVFDGDADKSEHDRKPEINLALQALCGEAEPVDFPETGARARYAAFKRDLTKDIPEEFGADEFYSARDEIAREMGWEDEPSRAQKNPVVLREVLRRMHEMDRRSGTLDDIVEAIRAVLAPPDAAAPRQDIGCLRPGGDANGSTRRPLRGGRSAGGGLH